MRKWAMKLFLFSSSLWLAAGPASAITTTGQITADETWSGTVTVTGDIAVLGGVLTIQPGTVV